MSGWSRVCRLVTSMPFMPGSRMSISTHVRVKLGDQFEGELTGAGLTNDLQVGVRVKNLTGAIPVQRVVVDDHNTYHRCLHADQATPCLGQPRRKSPTHQWVELIVTNGSDRGAARVRTEEHFD